jgi:glucose/arabinose dehydrogenase
MTAMNSSIRVVFLSFVVTVVGRVAAADDPEVGVGNNPQLPAPQKELIPEVEIAPAVGWSEGATPQPAKGWKVEVFAKDLAHPRSLLVLPNGDVLVAETNAPDRPEDNKGLKAKVMKSMRKKAGAAEPSANRITLLRDHDRDGVAELKTPFAEKLSSPYGMALVGDAFYVANTDAVVRYSYKAGETRVSGEPKTIATLPAGARNHHWTKSLAASTDGKRLYVGVGSNSNVAEHGMDEEKERAAVLEIDAGTGASRVYASGLRNPTDLEIGPDGKTLWAVVNERDELGNDLVPDYLTSVRQGAFYGWPYSYFGQNVDERVKPQKPELVAKAVVPDFGLGSHRAPLGLAFAHGKNLPPDFREGVFVGEHGSWNRKPVVGYKVVFVPFEDGKPKGPVQDVLTGFLNDKGEAQGRPVGVALDGRGGVLVADDVGNVVWRLSQDGETVAARAEPGRKR